MRGMSAKKAFTLMELLVVVGIMGFMGIMSVGGYRAMRRGMEERSVMENVNQFVRNAYQRAQIDRVPISVFFWNETHGELGDFSIGRVSGKAVAVRMRGRITGKSGQHLYDEFGDLQFESPQDLASSLSSRDPGRFIYRIDPSQSGGSLNRCRTLVKSETGQDGNASNDRLGLGGVMRGTSGEFYYEVHSSNKGMGVGGWNRGDAYGFEFDSLVLPRGYIFGRQYSSSASNPVQGEGARHYSPGGGGGQSIEVSSLRPNKSGRVEAQRLGKTQDPSQERNYDVKDLRK